MFSPFESTTTWSKAGSSIYATAGAQALFVLTTLMIKVSGSPCLPSLMSLRVKSASDGYGPMVSLGDTTHAAVDVAGGVVVVPLVVVVVVVVVVVGLVGLSPLHAEPNAAPAIPRRPSASRRLSGLTVLFCDICEL
jgi:hypothetical protein